MNTLSDISLWPKFLRKLIVLFVVVVNFGYFSGLNLLQQRTDFSAQGIEEQVLGNEENDTAVDYKFKMSEGHLSGLIHSHVLSLAPIFLIFGILFYLTNWPIWIRRFIASEMLLSLVTTFGGLKLLWMGHSWMTFLIILSGSLMHIGFVLASLGIIVQMINPAFRSLEQNPY